MKRTGRTKQELINELQLLHAQLAELERSEVERKRMEVSLRLFESGVKNIKDALVITRTERTAAPEIIYVNPAFEVITGYSSQEIIGKTTQMLHGSGTDSSEIERVIREIQGGNPYQGELIISHKDGTEFFTDMRVTPIFNQQGEFTHTITVFHDINAYKQAEMKLMQERILLRTVIDNLPDSIYAKDIAGRKTLANRTDVELMGLKSEAEALGKSDYDTYPEEIAAQFFVDDQNILITGQPVLNREELIIKDHGKEGWLLTSKLPLRNEQGEIIGLVGIGRDITKRKQMEESLKLSESRMKSLYELTQKDFKTENELIDYALDEAVRLTSSKIGFFLFIKADQVNLGLCTWSSETLKNCTVSTERHYPLNVAGVWADCARLKRPIVHNDYQTLPDKKGYPQGHPNIIRQMSIPIFEKDAIVAVLGLGNKEIPYDEADVMQMQLFINGVWNIISHKRGEEALLQHLAELEAVNKISTALRTAQTLEEMLPILLSETLSNLDVPAGAIFLHEAESQKLCRVIARGWLEKVPQTLIPTTEGILGLVFTSSKPYISKELVNDSQAPSGIGQNTPPGWGEAYLPIQSSQETIGVLVISFPLPREISDSETHLLNTISNIAGNAINRTRLHEKIKRSNEELQREINQRRNIQALLAKDKETLSVTLMNIGEGVISTDKNGVITLFNRAAGSITGYSLKEALGQPVEQVFQILDNNANRVIKNTIEHLLRPGEMAKVEEDYHEHTLLTKTDQKVLASVDVSPIRSKGDIIVGYIVMFEDITDKKMAEAHVILSQKMEAIGQLAAGIAHEINTPIQYVGDNVNFLNRAYGKLFDVLESYQQFIATHQDRVISSDDLAEFDHIKEQKKLEHYTKEIPTAIQESLDGIDRIRKIVLAIREFSHPSEKEMRASDINQGILTTITISRNEWKYYADLDTDLDPDLPPVFCQIDEINQVILNMIVNAAQAIQEVIPKNSEQKGKIHINTRHVGNKVLIAIQDSGCGIPESIRGRIFDPFFTTKALGKGTGQGLAIAHNIIVTKHKGRIRVDSKVGEGTTFTIELPVETS